MPSRAEILAMPARYMGATRFSGLAWNSADLQILGDLASNSIPVEKGADILGREPKALAWKASELKIKLPSEWYGLIRPRRIITESRALLSFPYIIKARDEHADILLVNSIVPRGLPEHIRADIVQDMLVSLLAGEITREGLRAGLSVHVKKVLRMHPVRYGLISLDALIPGTERRLLDTIADTSEPYDESEGDDVEAYEPQARKPLRHAAANHGCSFEPLRGRDAAPRGHSLGTNSPLRKPLRPTMDNSVLSSNCGKADWSGQVVARGHSAEIHPRKDTPK